MFSFIQTVSGNLFWGGTQKQKWLNGSVIEKGFSFGLQEKQTKEALTRKQAKGKKKGGVEEESKESTELLKRPKEYTVKFTFPNPPSLSPPILGLHSK